MTHFTTTLISDLIRERFERGIGDLLLSAYDAGYSAGAGIACEAATHPGLADLLTTLAERHRAEVLALREWADPPIRAADLPSWLLSLPSQSDNPQLRAAAERALALETERPEEWIRRVANEGRP